MSYRNQVDEFSMEQPKGHIGLARKPSINSMRSSISNYRDFNDITS